MSHIESQFWSTENYNYQYYYAIKKLNDTNLIQGLIQDAFCLVTLGAMAIAIPLGIFTAAILGPFIAHLTSQSNGLTALNGAILLSVMALPTMITVTEDALQGVPRSYKEDSYGVGANKWQTRTGCLQIERNIFC